MSGHGLRTVSVVAGIDISTTGARVVLVGHDGTVVGLGGAELVDDGPALTQVQEADGWCRAVATAFTRAREKAATVVSVEAIAVASQGITVVPLAESGLAEEQALSWLSAAEETVPIPPRVPWYAQSGRILTPASLPVRAQERAARGKAQPHRWALVAELVTAALAGRHLAGPCLASTTGLVDPRTRQWSPELLAAAGVDRRALPEIVESDTPTQLAETGTGQAGLQSPVAAELLRTFVPYLADTAVIAPPTQDQRAAVALADPSGDALVITTGTAAAIVATVPAALLDPRAAIPLTPSWLADRWELEGVVGAAGASLTWAADALHFDSVAALLDAAATAPRGGGGVEFAPHLGGSTAPWWDNRARGGFTGLSIGTTAADLARSVVNGVCREIVANCHAVEAISGRRDEVVTLGGLSRHPLIGATVADLLGRPVRSLPIIQPTALGAAVRAGSLLGWELAATITGPQRDAVRHEPSASAEDLR